MTEPTGPSDADLAAFVDAERGADAARRRSSERWLRQQALDEARLTGVLLGAAEQATQVLARTASGRSHTGSVVGLGEDFVALRTGAGALVYIRLDALTVVQVDRGLRALPAADERPAPRRAVLRDVLADEAAERPDITLFGFGLSDAVVGRLLAVGIDVATIEIDDRRTVAYVALASVTEASLRASG